MINRWMRKDNELSNLSLEYESKKKKRGLEENNDNRCSMYIHSWVERGKLIMSSEEGTTNASTPDLFQS